MKRVIEDDLEAEEEYREGEMNIGKTFTSLPEWGLSPEGRKQIRPWIEPAQHQLPQQITRLAATLFGRREIEESKEEREKEGGEMDAVGRFGAVAVDPGADPSLLVS